MTVDKKFFMDLLRDKGLSLRGLAKRLDILPSQLSLTFSGKRRMQMDEAVKISQVLGAPLSEVIKAAGISDIAGRRCKVTGILGGDGLIHQVEKGTVERVMTPEGVPTDCQAVQARTIESPLVWMDGWVFFCNGDHPPEEVLGRFCWVKTADNKELLATVRRGYSPGTFNLSGPLSLNSQRLEWARPVLVTRN